MRFDHYIRKEEGRRFYKSFHDFRFEIKWFRIDHLIFFLGISILYSKAKKAPPALFSFMEPLFRDVWLYMATSYLLVTMIVFLVAR